MLGTWPARDGGREPATPTAAVALAVGGTLLIRRAGGFVAAPTHAVFIISAQLPHNVSLTAESVFFPRCSRYW